MSADPITYCLEHVSDYRDFERLCSALLADSAYPGIDPLGGTGDRGRDAIVRRTSDGRTIVFAYTVRVDWRVKLQADCARVQEQAHSPDVLVFVCTEALTAAEKDWAHRLVEDEFGWQLDLYDMERMRVLLVGPHRHLVAQHPSIFAPPFFAQTGGQSLAESHDTILIDHVDADHALATWLSRHLTLHGYRTWCRGIAPFAGENADAGVRKLIERRGLQYLPVVSDASLTDQLFLERCALAAAKDSFVLPCRYRSGDDSRLPSRLKSLAAADFSDGWRDGVAHVLARLQVLGLKPVLESDQGRLIALRDYLPTRVTRAVSELVYSNLFALHLPQSILVIDLFRPLTSDEVSSLRTRWAFAVLGSLTLAAFTEPPTNAVPVTKPDRIPEFSWADSTTRAGRNCEDLAKELAWRSLEVVCAQKGLQYCSSRQLFYFPHSEEKDWDQPFRHVDGRQTTVQLTGTRTKGYGEKASKFRYQLAPRFKPWHAEDGTWEVMLNLYVRCTDLEGKVYEFEEVGRRRKIVTRSWWNNHWLARLLGVVQALQMVEGSLQIRVGKRAVAMDVKPKSWACPVGIDVEALSGLGDIGEELAEYRARDDEEEFDSDVTSVVTERQIK